VKVGSTWMTSGTSVGVTVGGTGVWVEVEVGLTVSCGLAVALGTGVSVGTGDGPVVKVGRGVSVFSACSVGSRLAVGLDAGGLQALTATAHRTTATSSGATPLLSMKCPPISSSCLLQPTPWSSAAQYLRALSKRRTKELPTQCWIDKTRAASSTEPRFARASLSLKPRPGHWRPCSSPPQHFCQARTRSTSTIAPRTMGSATLPISQRLGPI
jgi:hypothetical protein